MNIKPTTTGTSAPPQTPAAEEDTRVRRDVSPGRQPQPQPAPEHPLSRRTRFAPESARQRLPLERLISLPTTQDVSGGTSTQKQKGSSSDGEPLLITEDRSDRIPPEKISPLIGEGSSAAEGDARVRRGESLDRQQPPASEHPPHHTASMSRPESEVERPRFPFDRTLTRQLTVEDLIGGETSTQKETGTAQSPLLGTKVRSDSFSFEKISPLIGEGGAPGTLTPSPTFKDLVVEDPNARKLKGKEKIDVPPPLGVIPERIIRLQAEPDDVRRLVAGEHASGSATEPVTHSQRSRTSRMSRMSQGGSSRLSISSAGLGESRARRSTDSRASATSSRLYTPNVSEQFSLRASTELESGHRTRESEPSSSDIHAAGTGEERARHSTRSRDSATGSRTFTASHELKRESFRFSAEQMGGVHLTPQTPQIPIFGRSSSESSRDAARPDNWRATIAKLARTVGQQAVQTASVATVLQPNARLLTVAAGHLAHQAVSVGIPTFAREMLAQGLMAGLHRASPQVAVGLQVGMLAVNVTLQVVRERREAREPNEAARAFHALSADQWEQSSPQEQAAMRETQTRHSRLLSVLQVASSAVNLGLGAANVRSGDATAAIQRVATDVKTAVYTTMRDSLQASFRMVGIEGDTHGLGGAHLTTAIAAYAGEQLTFGYAGQALVAGAAPEASTATKVLQGLVSPAAAGMSTAAAWGTAATVAGVKAAVNAVGEAIDFYQRTQLEANQGGARQALAPRINSAPEHQDYGRLLDQTPARMAFVNIINSAVGTAGYLARNSSAAVQSLIGNVGSAAVGAMFDYSVSNTFQANGAVRAATRAPRPESATSSPSSEPNSANGNGATNSPTSEPNRAGGSGTTSTPQSAPNGAGGSGSAEQNA